jgi:hypothetical protein
MAYRWDSPEGSARASLDSAAADGIRMQTIDAFLSLPKRGAEIGGLLLGEVESAAPVGVRIVGFEPVPCEYRFGPSYVLSETDRKNLETALAAHADVGPSVVGLYRSYTGREPALDSADRDLVQSYFSGRPQVFLLLRPLAADQCEATFAYSIDGQLHGPWAPEPFPFLEGLVGQAVPPANGQAGETACPALTPDALATKASLFEPPPMRRPLPPPVRLRRYPGEETVPSRRRPRFWIPLLACIALSIGAAFVYEWWKLSGPRAPARPETPRVASADRLAAPPVVPPAAPAPVVTPSPARPEPRRQTRAPRARPAGPAPVAVAPVAVHKVQPGISDAIRSRISGRLIVPVQVRVSESGRVTSAVPEKGRDDAVYRYLSTRAASAARLWRFKPARTRAGAPVPAEKTLYFVFTR